MSVIVADRLSEERPLNDADAAALAVTFLPALADEAGDLLTDTLPRDETLVLRETLGERLAVALMDELFDVSAVRDTDAERSDERVNEELDELLAEKEGLRDAEADPASVGVGVAVGASTVTVGVRLTDELADADRVGEMLRLVDTLPDGLRVDVTDRVITAVRLGVEDTLRDRDGDAVPVSLLDADGLTVALISADADALTDGVARCDAVVRADLDTLDDTVVLALFNTTVGVTDAEMVTDDETAVVMVGVSPAETETSELGEAADGLGDDVTSADVDPRGESLTACDPETVFVPDMVALPTRVMEPDEECEVDAEIDGDLVVVFVAETLRDPDGDALGLGDVEGERVRRAVVDDDGVERTGDGVVAAETTAVRDTVDEIDASVTDRDSVADTLSRADVVAERLGQ